MTTTSPLLLPRDEPRGGPVQAGALATAPRALREHTPPAPVAGEPPVVVVGAGPVGMRFAHELARRSPATPIVVYGDEPQPLYNRVRLSSFLAGELSWAGMLDESPLDAGRIELRLGFAVLAIDRAAGAVLDAAGRRQPFSRLVLATGSRPVVPQVPGITLPGVYTFRDLDDAQALMARRVRSRHTVVVGGGLLGLEAARAMRRFGTAVCVLEHSPRLMARQLDDGGAVALRALLAERGIEAITDDALKEVRGRERVQSLLLRRGGTLPCDTLIVAAGIAPQVQLALDAGLPIGRGVRVDDCMRTADARIFAIGECAEHRGRVYGLAAPGFEQAAVAAHAVAGNEAARYGGSLVAARLKVLDTPVFSAGAIGDEMPDGARVVMHRDQDARGYRSLVLRRGRLVGATAVGAWDAVPRLQEAVAAARRVWPWQLWRFRRQGELWAQPQAADIGAWPDAAIVCQCTGVSCGALRAAMAQGAATPQALCAATGASSVCGSCRPQVQALLGSAAALEPAPGAAWLWAAGVAAAAGAAALLVLPAIEHARSADLPWRWDTIWRSPSYKQVSGFVLVALMATLAALGLRKRVRRIALGRFDGWRVVHVTLGAVALMALLVHTGGRAGANLNLALSLSLLGAAAAGALGSASIAREHRWPALARAWRRASVWAHVLLLWPLPVLLALHVLKFYFFGGSL
jgi:nitrite reductase (NADH) large subunit